MNKNWSVLDTYGPYQAQKLIADMCKILDHDWATEGWTACVRCKKSYRLDQDFESYKRQHS